MEQKIYVKQIVCNVKQKVCNVKQVVSLVAVCEMVKYITSNKMPQINNKTAGTNRMLTD